MRLFIAEKPSVAREIAALLPSGAVRRGSYIECGSDVVTWCRGHLLEALEPPDYNAAWKSWNLQHLPMMPDHFALRVAKDGKDQYEAVRALEKKASTIVHAGDIDREGQLIVDELLEFLGCRKPVLRLDTSSVDDVSLRRALSSLSDNSQNANITKAGHTRRNADWFFGMNLTRAFTLAAQKAGYREGVLNFGRVKTPTMRLVVDRDLEIEKFQSTPYYEVEARNEAVAGTFDATWKPNAATTVLDPEKRVIDKAIADATARKVMGQQGSVTKYVDDVRKQAPPLLFSLSALQQQASKQYGMSASSTLEVAQSLYEAKLTTYPRTDCRYLKDVQHADAGAILKNVATIHDGLAAHISQADKTRKSQVWNDKKVSAHHAIVPTQQRVDLTALSPQQRQIYDLIARSYVAQFLADYQFRLVSIEVDYAGEHFATSGATPLRPGWKALYPKAASAKGAASADAVPDDDGTDVAERALPELKVGERVTCVAATVKTRQTQPPKRFTEGTLIAAMANIHEYVQNPEIRKRLRDSAGIGTEATRAAMLEQLKKSDFFISQGKNIVSSTKARALITFVKDIFPQAADYGVTALFEQRLELIAEGKAVPDDLMRILDRFVRDAITAAFSRPLVIPTELRSGKPGVDRASPLSRARQKKGAWKKRGAA